MQQNHNGYLNYELPESWCVEENEDQLVLYNPNGEGAMVLSFFNVLSNEVSLEEQIIVMAKKFLDKNTIKLKGSLILVNTEEGKTVLYGEGTTCDAWFMKLWLVAKKRKIVFATYESEQKTDEIKICDSIVNSFYFVY